VTAQVGDPWLDKTDIAQAAGVSVFTVMRRVKEGTFPPSNGTGRFRRWRKSVVDKAIAEGKLSRQPS
jgi:predicted DNA-binding transcriptional regulator AlpA